MNTKMNYESTTTVKALVVGILAFAAVCLFVPVCNLLCYCAEKTSSFYASMKEKYRSRKACKTAA